VFDGHDGTRASDFTVQRLPAELLLGQLTGLLFVEGDRGAEDREKTWREVYERREKRGGKWNSQGGRKWDKKGGNYATLCNILQSKKCKEEGANKYRMGTGIKGYWKQEV